SSDVCSSDLSGSEHGKYTLHSGGSKHIAADWLACDDEWRPGERSTMIPAGIDTGHSPLEYKVDSGPMNASPAQLHRFIGYDQETRCSKPPESPPAQSYRKY